MKQLFLRIMALNASAAADAAGSSPSRPTSSRPFASSVRLPAQRTARPGRWPLLLLALIFSSVGSVASRADVVVMSYNILRQEWAKPGFPSWEERVNGVCHVIGKASPDIVALQEETESMVAELLQQLPDYDYLYPVPNMGAGLMIRRGMWTAETSRRKQTPDGRTATEVLLRSATGQRLYVYNIHFSPFEQFRKLDAAALLLHLIETRSEKDIPVIAMGDLNSTPTSAPFAKLMDPTQPVHLRDPFAELKVAHETSFHGYRTTDTPHRFQIDHILFLGPLEPVAAQVLAAKHDGIFPSDHHPILCTFAFKPAASR